VMASPTTFRSSAIAPSRIVMAVTLVLLAFFGRDLYRNFEAQSAGWLANLFGVDGLRSVGDAKILVIPEASAPFFALVSFGCSSLAVLASFALVAVLIIRGSVGRRLGAAAFVAVLLFTVNVIRVAAVSSIGASYGLGRMAQAHDWFGTAVTLLGCVAAAAGLYLIAALPAKGPHAQTENWRA
jgi:exosortase/archaeosortase family protein